MKTCPRCESKKEKPSANRRSKALGKYTNAKPAFSHGDPVNRKASRIRRHSTRHLKSIRKKQRRPHMFPLSRKEKRNADGALAGGALHAFRRNGA